MKEKYISERYYKNKLISYQVKIRYVDLSGIDRLYINNFKISEYTSQKDALEAAKLDRDKAKYLINQNKIHHDKYITVRELFILSNEIFIESVETINKRIKRYNKYIYPFFDNLNIKSITAADIQKSLNRMKKDASDDTIGHVCRIWNLIFKAAKMNKYIDYNLMDEIIKPKSEKITTKKSVDTCLEDFLKVIELLKQHTSKKYKRIHRLHIIGMWIMYYTGMRPAEVFALNIDSIDLKNRLIYVKQSIGSTSEEKKTIKKTKTTSSIRCIPISDKLAPILEELLEISTEDLLFNVDGRLFPIEYATNKITRICEKHNIKFNMYRLRHKFSTDLITSNVDPRSVMELMGHKTAIMTLEYARSNDELKREIINNRKDS